MSIKPSVMSFEVEGEQYLGSFLIQTAVYVPELPSGGKATIENIARGELCDCVVFSSRGDEVVIEFPKGLKVVDPRCSVLEGGIVYLYYYRVNRAGGS